MLHTLHFTQRYPNTESTFSVERGGIQASMSSWIASRTVEVNSRFLDFSLSGRCPRRDDNTGSLNWELVLWACKSIRNHYTHCLILFHALSHVLFVQTLILILSDAMFFSVILTCTNAAKNTKDNVVPSHNCTHGHDTSEGHSILSPNNMISKHGFPILLAQIVVLLLFAWMSYAQWMNTILISRLFSFPRKIVTRIE